MSVSKWRIFDTYPLHFTKGELAALPKPFVTFLIASSLAANDLSIFLRLVLSYQHSRSKNDIINEYVLVHSLTATRNLAAKAYEMVAVFDDLIKQCARSGEDIPYLREEIVPSIEAIKSDRNFHIAKEIRDEATNHYVGPRLLRWLSEFSESHRFSMHITEMVGNSLYVMGEEIVSVPRLGNPESIESFLDWVLKTVSGLQKIHQGMLIHIINEHFPDKKLRRKQNFVDEGYCAPITQLAPVFVYLTPEEEAALELRKTRRANEGAASSD